MLREWGAAATPQDVTYAGHGLLHQAIPDILYPLAKTYTQLLEGNSSISIVSNITFRKEVHPRLGEGAQLAARLMYDSVK
jgi:hypothetical protein